jgi:hypothetical protein
MHVDIKPAEIVPGYGRQLGSVDSAAKQDLMGELEVGESLRRRILIDEPSESMS